MLIRNWSFFCAGVLALQVLALGALPFDPGAWDKAWHCIAFAALTLLLWMATDGRRPLLVVLGVMAFGFIDELRQAASPARSAELFDFLADSVAAAITGAVLYWKTGATKTCAASSAQ
jgi:di/tricarboxylate transporter